MVKPSVVMGLICAADRKGQEESERQNLNGRIRVPDQSIGRERPLKCQQQLPIIVPSQNADPMQRTPHSINSLNELVKNNSTILIKLLNFELNPESRSCRSARSERLDSRQILANRLCTNFLNDYLNLDKVFFVTIFSPFLRRWKTTLVLSVR
jgi:hypothetical protein